MISNKTFNTSVEKALQSHRSPTEEALVGEAEHQAVRHVRIACNLETAFAHHWSLAGFSKRSLRSLQAGVCMRSINVEDYKTVVWLPSRQTSVTAEATFPPTKGTTLSAWAPTRPLRPERYRVAPGIRLIVSVSMAFMTGSSKRVASTTAERTRSV